MKKYATLLLSCILCVFVVPVCSKLNTTNGHEPGEGIVLFKFDFGHVAKPFVVCCWVLLASLAKIGFHHSEWISSTIPESCMLILLGVPIGFILRAAHIHDGSHIYLTSDLFFYFLLPPIILDAGYFMPSHVFYYNIGTILLYAIFGTIFNSFAVGLSLYATDGISGVGLSLLHALLFGSLISAVDPVAVLAVFEEVHVHEILYMLVFGESVLNDAASVVLYRTFESLINGTVNGHQIGLAIASFFVVSIGGTIIGIAFALLTSFITKFTEHVRVIEPAFVFLMAYMAYLSAEIFHFSGIMSILFCGIVMKPYVESNVSRKSHTTIKYFLKLLSTSCESIIFMFLGVSLVHSKHEFNYKFVCFTLLFITIYRAIGVVILTGFANKCGRLTKVKKVEQFIMSYGGLRGAVAFCLAVLLKPSSKLRDTIVTTTITVVMFTVFIQGTTIKKLVEVLGVKKASKNEKTMSETLNDRVLGYMVAGVEEIMGVHGHGFFRNLLEHWNRKYLRQWLERDPELLLDEEMVSAQRRMAFKHALTYANNPSMIMDREMGEATLNDLRRNPSFAMQMALKAQDSMGAECGLIDANILTADRGESGYDICSGAFNPRTIGSLIPKARKTRKRTYSKRKYTLDSLEENEAIEDRYIRFKRNSLAREAPRQSSLISIPKKHREHHHRHKHKKQKRGRSKKPDMDTLPEVTEAEETILDIRATYDHRLKVPGTVALDVDIKGESESDTEGEEGISFLVPRDRSDSSPGSHNVPGLPSYSDTPFLSQYSNNPVLDRVPKQLTERDKEDLLEAARWRSFSIESFQDQPNEDTVSIINPWSEPLSSPLKSNIGESNFHDGHRDVAFSIETAF